MTRSHRARQPGACLCGGQANRLAPQIVELVERAAPRAAQHDHATRVVAQLLRSWPCNGTTAQQWFSSVT